MRYFCLWSISIVTVLECLWNILQRPLYLPLMPFTDFFLADSLTVPTLSQCLGSTPWLAELSWNNNGYMVMVLTSSSLIYLAYTSGQSSPHQVLLALTTPTAVYLPFSFSCRDPPESPCPCSPPMAHRWKSLDIMISRYCDFMCWWKVRFGLINFGSLAFRYLPYCPFYMKQ